MNFLQLWVGGMSPFAPWVPISIISYVTSSPFWLIENQTVHWMNGLPTGVKMIEFLSYDVNWGEILLYFDLKFHWLLDKRIKFDSENKKKWNF